MQTAKMPNAETLVKLAADHPEKLDTINEFLKNIILFVDMTNKPVNHGFTVMTNKVKLNGRKYVNNPMPHYSYFVTISDGKREAHFTNDGESTLSLADFTSGSNANGLEFWAMRSNPGQLHKLRQWQKGQSKNIELCDMQNFIDQCLKVPVYFAEVGRRSYTY